MTYQDFFKLSDTPFRLTPDVDYFYNSEGHGAALETLLYSIRSGEGFVQITGQPGVGKTLLVRHLLNQLGGEIKTALILHPRLGAEDLLKVILEDLGVSTDIIENNTKEGLLRFFRKHLLDAGEKGSTTVVIVDEAQEIPDDTLEELRLLSNLETEKKKLLSIILVGQTELEEKLNRQSLRQLHQRITIRYRIEPFTRKETFDYILHRLSIAGATENVHFSDRVLHTIHKKSAGIPRRINIICERALMAACVEGVRTIKKSHLKSALESYLGSTPIFNAHRFAVGVTALLIAVFITGGAWYAIYPEHLAFFLANRQSLTAAQKANIPGEPAVTGIEASTPGSLNQAPMTPDAGMVSRHENPPIDMLPENWRCLELSRRNDQGQVWQGDGKSVAKVASFKTDGIPIDNGIYLLGRNSNSAFILNHYDFSPWQHYRGFAEQLWSQFGVDTGLPAIPLIVWSGENGAQTEAFCDATGEIKGMVKKWADAWRSLDIDAYIQYYGPTHVNYRSIRNKPTIISRDQYYKRKGRFFRQIGSITLQISEPVCMINPTNPNAAVAFFSQRYASAHYLDEGVKVLFLRRLTEGNDDRQAWKIEGRFWLPMPKASKG